ncbi:hypothetical protein CR513_54875, partial [Mucuna pruriens]
FKLVGFCDSDFVGDVDDRKSTTGFVFFMGGCAFTWSSKKQVIVTLSTCEAEYVAATSCTCQAIWLRRLLKEFNMNQEESTKIHIDNKSTQILAKNPKDVELVHVKTQDQVADIFTKPLRFEDFRRLRARLVIMAEDKVITLGPNELPNLYIRTTLKGRKKLSHIEGNRLPKDDPKFEA